MEQKDTPPHDHNCFELAYILEGSAVQVLDGNSVRVKKGDYFIVDYGSKHGYSRCRNMKLINCMFVSEMLDEALTDCQSFEQLIRICLIRYSRQYSGQAAAGRIFQDQDGRVLQLLRGIMEEYHSKQTGYKEVFRCRMLELLILTMRKVLEKENTEVLDKTQSFAVTEAVRYINAHYAEKSILGKFCEQYHYSLQYMSRRFKQETGMTAQEYIQKVRIEKSCELLKGGQLSIQEVARAVGYEDVKFFNQLFRKMIQMTPGEYRKILE